MVTKVNAIDTKIPNTSGLVSKTHHELDKQGLEKTDVDIKISNIRGLVKNTDYNTKIAEIEIKIPSVTGLVPAAALNKKKSSRD